MQLWGKRLTPKRVFQNSKSSVPRSLAPAYMLPHTRAGLQLGELAPGLGMHSTLTELCSFSWFLPEQNCKDFSQFVEYYIDNEDP